MIIDVTDLTFPDSLCRPDYNAAVTEQCLCLSVHIIMHRRAVFILIGALVLVGSIVAVILAVSLSGNDEDKKTASGDGSDPNEPVDSTDIIGGGIGALPRMPTSDPESGK